MVAGFLLPISFYIGCNSNDVLADKYLPKQHMTKNQH